MAASTAFQTMYGGMLETQEKKVIELALFELPSKIEALSARLGVRRLALLLEQEIERLPLFATDPVFVDVDSEKQHSWNIDCGDYITTEILQLKMNLATLKLWLSLHRPNSDEDDPKRTDKQDELYSMLSMDSLHFFSFTSQLANYFTARGKIAILMEKFPNIKGFEKTLALLDYRHYHLFLATIKDLLGFYLTLYDFLVTKFDLIIAPDQPASFNRLY